MFHQWENDRLYLERKFNDKSFYDNAPGIPLAELNVMLEKLAAADRNLPHMTAKARGLAMLFRNCRIDVSNSDYFPGLEFAKVRPLGKDYVQFWANQAWQTIFSEEERRDHSLCEQVNVSFVRFDFDHSVPNWDAVLQLGFPGLLARVLTCKEQRKASGKFTEEARIYFEALETVYTAVLDLLDRLISEAAKLPVQPKGRRILEALKNLRYGHAENFYEALLQIWLYFLLSEYGDHVQARSFGNLDRILYSYYRNDLTGGKFTKEDIRCFIRSFMYQSTAIHHKVGHPFYFGGTNADGSSAINELSYLILDEYEQMNIFDPKLHIKVSENTPQDFIDKALNLIRNGNNSIVFVGEPCIIRTMQKYGYSRRQAETADIKGCYEYCVRGDTVETAPVTVNAVKVLGITLHNGIEILSGQKLGIETGELTNFTTFGKLYRAFLKQLFYRCECCINIADKMESVYAEVNPAPVISATFESSLRSAIDGYAKGAKYNNSNLWICGAATTGDSLYMIKKYVFERKEFTLSELVGILDRDFEGNELLRLRLLNDREKFGNNLEQPDNVTIHFAEAVAKRFNKRRNARGGFYTSSLHASNRFIQWAPTVEATADGRHKGDELSKNMSSSQGCSFNGATALINSVLKFDSALFMANLPVDVMLHPSEVRGPAGLSAMRSLLMTYIKNYGHAIQFNVMDPEILKQAQKEPEKFRHLQVRICGWNVLWNSIPREEQDAYIRQAERL